MPFGRVFWVAQQQPAAAFDDLTRFWVITELIGTVDADPVDNLRPYFATTWNKS